VALSQNEQFSLTKQKNLKNKLKSIIKSLDPTNCGSVPFVKFQIEVLDLGIKLNATDLENIILLYED
jgi:hypothetical protein